MRRGQHSQTSVRGHIAQLGVMCRALCPRASEWQVLARSASDDPSSQSSAEDQTDQRHGLKKTVYASHFESSHEAICSAVRNEILAFGNDTFGFSCVRRESSRQRLVDAFQLNDDTGHPAVPTSLDVKAVDFGCWVHDGISDSSESGSMFLNTHAEVANHAPTGRWDQGSASSNAEQDAGKKYAGASVLPRNLDELKWGHIEPLMFVDEMKVSADWSLDQMKAPLHRPKCKTRSNGDADET